MPFSGSGSGTEISPYEITSWAQLNEVRDYDTAFFILMNDLGPSDTGYDTYASSSANGGEGWIPLYVFPDPFYGSLDGQFHTITGLYINNTNGEQGLFGYLGDECSIKRLGLLDVDITSIDFCGAVAAIMEGGVLDECWATGSVAGDDWIGGLVGGLYAGTIRSCYSACSVLGDDHIGGLVGDGSGDVSIIDCYSTGNVVENESVRDGDFIGGFIGEAYGANFVITNCYSTGLVDSGDEAATTGGFCGSYTDAVINGCFWNTETSGLAVSSGGVGKTTTELKDMDLFTTQTYYPPTTIDQTTSDSGYSFTGGTAGSGEGDQQLAQSFVATSSSIYSVKIALWFDGTPSDDVVVTITSSLGGSSLGSKSINASLLISDGINEFVFASPISVTATSTYYIQISRSGARDASNYYVIYAQDAADNYAGGQVYYRSNTTWSGTGYESNDLYFVVVNGDGSGTPGGVVEPWDIVSVSAYTTEDWKMVDGVTYPMLGYEEYELPGNPGAFFAFL